ncbi:MAG: circadian clock KaiB family protein [Burkholderiales bacterium]|nr:circadian clock KaiB family protein [Burkholderiales bacterium]
MSEAPLVRLRLYVAGDAQNSLAAVANLHDICDRYLPARHQIELVDVLREPARALSDGVLMTPMLVKFAPLPVRKVVGSLNQTEVVLQALGLPALAA